MAPPRAARYPPRRSPRQRFERYAARWLRGMSLAALVVETRSALTCEDNRDCDYCVGYFADAEDCVWCPDVGRCSHQDEVDAICGAYAQSTTECPEDDWSSFAVFVLFALLVSLCCFCCSACLFKRVRRATMGRIRGGNGEYDEFDEHDLESPLLSEPTLVEEAEAEALTSVGAAESNSIWTCPICGFDNFLEHQFCTLCAISRRAADEHVAARAAYLTALEGRRRRTSDHLRAVGGGDGEEDGGLTQEERAISFYLRHLNSLTRRQRGASKRRLWRRVRGEDGGLYWARARSDRMGAGTGKPEDDTGPRGHRPRLDVNDPRQSDFGAFRPGDDAASDADSEGFGLGLGLEAEGYEGDGGWTESRVVQDDAAFLSVYQASGEVEWAMVSPDAAGAADAAEPAKPAAEPHEVRHEAAPATLTATPIRSESSVSDISTTGVLLRSPGDRGASLTESLLPPAAQPSFFERIFGGPPPPVERSTRRMSLPAEAPTDLAHADPHLSHVCFRCCERQASPGSRRSRHRTPPQAADLAAVAAMPFRRKHAWFLRRLEAIRQPWEAGHARVEIRRSRLAEDSLEQIMRLSQSALRSRLRVVFADEPGVDAGGLVREWLTLVAEQVFGEGIERGGWRGRGVAKLFAHCGEAVHIAPRDRSRVTRELNRMYQFAGRIVGKALLEQVTIGAARLSTALLKQLLGMPVSVSDLEFVDPELHQNLVWLERNAGVADLHLDFSVQIRDPDDEKVFTAVLGPAHSDPRGDVPAVTDENKRAYVRYRLRHRLLDTCGAQLWHFTKGLHEVIPPSLLCVFDHQELELLLCGVGVISTEQWREWTDYTGEFEEEGPAHPVVRWFWDIVSEMAETEKARLLQFCTGSAALPASGFRALQSNDGRVRRFTLQGVPSETQPYPRAHTCFNRLDLPVYETRERLEMFLSYATAMDVTGFSMS